MDEIWFAVKLLALVAAAGWVWNLVTSHKPDELAYPSEDKMANQEKSDTTGVIETDVLPDAYIVGEVDEPLIQLRPMRNVARLEGSPIELTPHAKKHLSGMLANLPALALSGQVMAQGGQCFQVVFSPETAKALQEGSAHLIQSGNIMKAVAVGENGKIKELGHVIKGGVPTGPAAALMVWQVAAMITAQKFLADISKQLKSIEDGITNIKNWLDDEQWGKIKGIYDFVAQRILQIERESNLTPEYMNRMLQGLEGLELEVLQMDSMLERQIERTVEDAQYLEDRRLSLKIQEMETDLGKLQEQLRRKGICAKVRMGISMIRLRLGDNPSLESVKFDALQEDMERTSNLVKAFFKGTEGNLGKLEHSFVDVFRILGGGATDEDVEAITKRVTESQLDCTLDLVQAQLDTKQASLEAHMMDLRKAEPIQLQVQYDPERKQIVAANHLESALT